MTKQIITQNPSPPPSPTSQPESYYVDLFTTFGIVGGTFIIFAIALVVGLPKYVKGRVEAENRERLSDLTRDEKIFDTFIAIINTLLANLLQSTREQREEHASQLEILTKQMTVVLQQLNQHAQNQKSFFPIAERLRREVAQIRLEITKIKRGNGDDRAKENNP